MCTKPNNMKQIRSTYLDKYKKFFSVQIAKLCLVLGWLHWHRDGSQSLSWKLWCVEEGVGTLCHKWRDWMQQSAPQVYITLAVTERKTYIRGKASESPECIGEKRTKKPSVRASMTTWTFSVQNTVWTRIQAVQGRLCFGTQRQTATLLKSKSTVCRVHQSLSFKYPSLINEISETHLKNIHKLKTCV